MTSCNVIRGWAGSWACGAARSTHGRDRAIASFGSPRELLWGAHQLDALRQGCAVVSPFRVRRSWRAGAQVGAQVGRCVFWHRPAVVEPWMRRADVDPETSCARRRVECPLAGGLFSSGSAWGVGVGAWVPNVTAAVLWIGPLAMSRPARAKVVNGTSDLLMSPHRLPARPAVVRGMGAGRKRQRGPRTCDRR